MPAFNTLWHNTFRERHQILDSATQISVAIPPSATTGPISVTTPGGTGTSSGDFLKNNLTSSVVVGNGIATISEGPGSLSSIAFPNSVTTNSISRFFVASANLPVIQLVEIIPGAPDTLVTTFAGNGTAGYIDGQGTAARFNGIQGMTMDSQGNLFVADNNNRRIRKVTLSGEVSTFAGSGTNGYLDGNAATARFENMNGLAVDSQDNLYLTELIGSQGLYLIRKITPTGDVTTYAGSTGGAINGELSGAKFLNPKGIAIDSNDNIYVADTSNNQIRKITPAGQVSTLAGNSTPGLVNANGVFAQFNAPEGIAVDRFGNVYVADTGNNAIRKITPTGNVTTLMSGISSPKGITVDPNGIVYAASYLTHKVYRILQ